MPASGELLRIAGEQATLVIHGRSPALPFPELNPQPSRPSLYALGKGFRACTQAEDFAGLYDDITYTVVLFAPAPCQVTLTGFPLDLEWTSDQDRWVGHARLSFAQIGWAELMVWAQKPFGVRVAVHSRKLDYQTDYQLMVQSLEEQVRGLTAQAVSQTLYPTRLGETPEDLALHWLVTVQTLWTDLRRHLEMAWHTLPLQLEAEERRRFIGQIRQPRWVEAARYAATSNPVVSSPVPVWQTLSQERRYLLHLLQDLHGRLQSLTQLAPRLAEHVAIRQVQAEVVELWGRYQAAAGPVRLKGPVVIPNSPLAEAHPALRQVIRLHRQLNRGLFPDAGAFFLGLKNIHRLYEYWCYLTILRLIVEESKGHLEVEPAVERNPVHIALRAGLDRPARVVTAGGASSAVYYQPKYAGLPTVSQQPDYVVRLQGPNGALIFDAKYRFELDRERLRHYGEGLPIPPVETLNTMHQYRDAIVVADGEAYRRLANRAIVLFPLPSPYWQRWAQHRFHRSIESVGIGALPLLPSGSDQGLRELLRRYLLDQEKESGL
jgi:hypothetical protein